MTVVEDSPEATDWAQSSWNCITLFALMTFSLGKNMGHVVSKTRSLGQIKVKPVNTLEATNWAESSCKCIRLFALMTFRSGMKMGHIVSKNRSLGQIKTCKHPRCNKLSSLFLILYQIVCYDDLQFRYEYGSCSVEN